MKTHNLQWLLSGVLLFFLITTFVTTEVFAQTAILRGTVTDAETGAVLMGANVAVTSEAVNTGAATGPTGTFEVTNLPAGRYTVTVTYIGYEKQVLTDLVLTAGETKSLDISLTPTGIQLNPVTITASRRPEKLLEAPAAITVLQASEIQNRPMLTPTDQLRGLPAVDIGSKGIVQSNVVIRGFNDIISATLQTLTDYRYEHVPSLRYNVPHLISLTNEDIARIEVVSGPGSALYGPNSANGVVHFISRSPFESEGTTVSVGGGGRDFFNISDRDPRGGSDIFTATVRHARRLGKKVGFKISAQYLRGEDWQSFDAAEPDTVVLFRPTPTGIETEGGPQPNQRDFDVERFAGEARLDLRVSEDATLIFAGGLTRADEVELVQTGAAQIRGWTHKYAQTRLNYKDLFVQGFVNASNSGDTYLLRTGQFIDDFSKLFGGQAQHRLSVGERQRFTYGFDALLTRPDTRRTIHGRNEDRDNVNELGLYLQSETKLSSKLDLVLAGRVDDHSHLENPVFSPRAALVFKPSPEHNFRLTYNRAYTTPTASQLFGDLLARSVPNPLNPNKPLIAVRLTGVPSESGFTFHRGSDGRPMMMTQLLPPETGYVPATVNSIWPTLRQILIAQSPAQIQALLNATLPQQLSGTVVGDLRSLNPSTGSFDLVADVKDIDPLRPTINNTFEFGYKGVIGNKLFLAVDVYHTRFNDFIPLFRTETPNVFANPQQLGAALQPTAVAIANALIAQGLPPEQAQAQAAQIVTGLVTAAARLPLGVISPEQIANDTDVLLTYRNFGKVSVNGFDATFAYYLNRNWSFSGNYSFITKSSFNPFKRPNHVIWRNLDGIGNVSLNAAGNKAGLAVKYRNSEKGLDAELRYRYVEGFPMISGVHIGDIKSYTLFDLNLAYEVPFSKNTRLMLSAMNLFDNKHREFVDAPEMGRLILGRIVQSF
ncbi:MAG: TonB-dependent receptor domain-containing protein [bacterium]